MKTTVSFAALLGAVCGGVFLAAQQPAQPQPAAPQEPPPVTFRVEVNYVEVDAIVTDAQGAVVTTLRAEDFQVLEDGKPQTISAFSHVNIPIERVERPLFAAYPIEADVQTNEHAEGRIYLLVLDDIHTDLTRAPRVKAAARRFIEESFGLNDLAAVVYTGGRSDDSQDFTNNRRLLLAAIDKFTGRKLRSATLERLDNLTTDPAGNVVVGADSAEMERAFRARSVMSTVRKLADFMAGVRGRRKAMLLIGEGVDYNIYDVMGLAGTTASSVLLDTQDAIAAATRGNVAIYAIDPRGLATGGEELIQTSTTLPEQGAGLNSMQSELRLSQDSLRVLAANTGGFAAVNRNDFDGAFDRIVAENSSYYVLGYYAANPRRDGRFRKIEVRVTRPGLRVRSRNGYYEARGRRPSDPAPPTIAPALADAVGSPIPVTGIPIQVFAAPFKGTAPNASVALAIHLDASTLDFVEKDGAFLERLEVLQSATDVKGKTFPGEKHSVNLTMKPDTYARVKAHGLRVLSQVDLPPGRYQLRVAAANRNGKAGSVVYDLEVPDFSSGPLTMSGVALTAASALEVATIKPKDPLADFLPSPATTAREFEAGDILVLFAEFYENQPNLPRHEIDLKAELRAEGGRVVREITDRRSSSELQGATGGYGFGARLPLEGVEPGLYVIHVEGRARVGQQPTVSRDIQIRVR